MTSTKRDDCPLCLNWHQSLALFLGFLSAAVVLYFALPSIPENSRGYVLVSGFIFWALASTVLTAIFHGIARMFRPTAD